VTKETLKVRLKSWGTEQKHRCFDYYRAGLGTLESN